MDYTIPEVINWSPKRGTSDNFERSRSRGGRSSEVAATTAESVVKERNQEGHRWKGLL